MSTGSNRERAAAWALAALLVAGSLFVGYAGTPYTAPADDLREARENPDVTLSALDGGGYAITPAGGVGDRALVFYPGGRVAPDAYVPVFAPFVADTGVTVVVPKPPLNLAVFDPGMAGRVVARSPDVETWYVGGHSLGGAMACRYAHRNPDPVAGLLLFAAYCDRDVSDAGVRVLAVRGSRDGVLNRDAYRRNRGNLPADATEVVLDGVNHSQFGAYRGQPGDRSATVTYATAHERIRRVTAAFLAGNASASP